MRIRIHNPGTGYLLVYDHLFQLPLGGGSLNNLLVDGSARHQPATQCELYSKIQCCGSVMFIPDSGSSKSTKRGGGKKNFPYLFVATNIIKL
jgi:hypothetical protein